MEREQNERGRISRRHFLEAAATGLALPFSAKAAPAELLDQALQSGPAESTNSHKEKLIGIQIGAVSFTDEGVGKVLDILQERAGVNALMLATFTYGRGIAGRQIPGQPLPDHGAQQYDTATFHGGDYASVHPQYYRDSVFRDFRAPDVGNFDILGDVAPKAKARGIKSYCWFEDVYNPRYLANFEQDAAEVDVDGRPARTACLNNPHVRNFMASMIEDWIQSYDVDGVMWCSERQGPLDKCHWHRRGRFSRARGTHLLLSILPRKSKESGNSCGTRPPRPAEAPAVGENGSAGSAPRRRLFRYLLACPRGLPGNYGLGEALDG